jgi:hypothetical protein
MYTVYHRDKSSTEWPEYAVKVVSAETIQKEGYVGAVMRYGHF